MVTNFSNSSSIAAKAISLGADAAIGFYNEVDDLVAESFFANFYLAWRLADWDLSDAFKLAWSELIEDTPALKIRGLSVTLWSRRSLLDAEKKRRTNARIPTMSTDPPQALRTRFDDETSKPATVSVLSKTLKVRIRSYRELNYCQLHNNRNLFDFFYIRKTEGEGVIDNVTVEVSLYAGPERLTFRGRKDLRYAIWDLADEVRVPLTATLPRVLKESMYTGLHVKVCAADRAIYENTFRVNLLPIDHWQDDDQNRKWLPSFVLPRDPAISRIIRIAQKYLVTLSDDLAAGFVGYPNPEYQARAIWYALVNEFNLRYLTIPPAFVARTQRLRSPSETLEGNRGNCIDLALLYAAVLESIGIYPIVFLLKGHAFPGYYNTRQAHDETMEYVLRRATSEQDAWMLGKEYGANLRKSVADGEIVAVDTTGLTNGASFSNSREAAQKQLVTEDSFEFLVDIRLARDHGVTPLPL